MSYYIGVDVSKETLSVFDGKKDLTFKNEKSLKELKSYLKKKFKTLDNIVIIFEATGVYSNYLKDFCSSNLIKAFIVNPKKNSGLAKVLGNRSKTDKTNARMLYAFKNIIDADVAEIPKADKEAKALFQYLSSYELIVKMRTSISNHIKSMEYVADTPKNILRELKQLNEKEKQLEEKILNEAEKYIESRKELSEDYHNLLTIPGIGRVTAIALLYVFTNYKGTNRSQIIALLGLDPMRKESGKSVRGGRKISKGGNKIVRKILYFPTMSAIQHNEKIKTFYDRLLENHKLKKLALIYLNSFKMQNRI